MLLGRGSLRSGLLLVQTTGAVAPAGKPTCVSSTASTPSFPRRVRTARLYPAGSSAAQRVFLEFKTAIESIPDGLPKARALATLSSVAGVADSQTFHRYAGSQNDWMKSAALAGIARIDPRPANVATMLEDLRRRGVLGDATGHGSGNRTLHRLVRPGRRRAVWRVAKGQGDVRTGARAYLPAYRAFADTPGATSLTLHCHRGAQGRRHRRGLAPTLSEAP